MRIFLTSLMAVGVLCVCFVLFSRTSYVWWFNQIRRRLGFAPKRKPTIEDVKRLLRRNERELAIFVYSHIYGLTDTQSRREIPLLERTVMREDQNC